VKGVSAFVFPVTTIRSPWPDCCPAMEMLKTVSVAGKRAGPGMARCGAGERFGAQSGARTHVREFRPPFRFHPRRRQAGLIFPAERGRIWNHEGTENTKEQPSLLVREAYLRTQMLNNEAVRQREVCCARTRAILPFSHCLTVNSFRVLRDSVVNPFWSQRCFKALW
jgi:hypothetical protein